MADSSLYIGVQTRDLPTIGSAGVTGSNMNTAGVLGFFERGTDEVHVINPGNPSLVAEIFGSHKSGMYGRYVVDALIKNLQGAPSYLYVQRMIHDDLVVATLNVNNVNTPAHPVLQIDAGRRGVVDKGTWGNSLRITTTVTYRAATTILTSETPAQNDTTLLMTSVAPFEVGDVILFDGTNKHTTIVTAIDETAGTITFEDGLPASCPAADDPVKVKDFKLEIFRKDVTTGVISDALETWENLAIDPRSVNYYFADKINDAYSGSKYIKVTHLVTAEADTYEDFPAAISLTALAAGSNGTDPSDADMGVLLTNFDDYPVKYLTNAESFTNEVYDDGELYCKGRGDCIWIGCPPSTSDTVAEKITWAQRTQKSRKVYAFNIMDWYEVIDPLSKVNALISIPPVGMMIGYTIYITNLRGVHKVPASRLQTPVGITSLTNEVTSRDDLRDIANVGGNSLTDIVGAFAVRSARTPSKLPEYAFVNSVIMSIYFKKSFEESFADLENEPTTGVLGFISDKMNRFAQRFAVSSSNGGNEGGFGLGSPQYIVQVIDDVLNPQSQISAGVVKANFYFRAPAPAERILIGVGMIYGE